MKKLGPKIILQVAGPLRLVTAQGADLTPRGMKARGALAAMATARDMRMSRSRLQDLLWSGSAPDQGAASLRQALREIRASLGAWRAVLLTGPGWVGLDPQALHLDAAAPAEPGTEFCADLDIRDPEFEDWLREMRAHHAALWDGRAAPAAAAVRGHAPADAAGLPDLVVLPVAAGDEPSAIAGTMLLQEAAARGADLLPMAVWDGSGGEGSAPATGLELSGMATREADGCAVLVVLRDRASRRNLWLKRFRLDSAHLSETLGAAVGQIAFALLRAAETWTDRSLAARLPVSDVFSYAADRLDAADRALARFEGLAEPATIWALRAYLRNTQVLERLAPDARQAEDEAQDFAVRALERGPDNPVVLSAASLVASLRREPEAAHVLARHAVAADPGNGLARLALSQSLSEIGRHDEALAEARVARAHPIAALGPATWEMRQAIAALRAGRLDEAERHAATALGFAPAYRPPLRLLAALRHRRGDLAGAVDALSRLRRFEPDFTLDRMAEPDYPVASLRALGLLLVTRDPGLRERFG